MAAQDVRQGCGNALGRVRREHRSLQRDGRQAPGHGRLHGVPRERPAHQALAGAHARQERQKGRTLHRRIRRAAPRQAHAIPDPVGGLRGAENAVHAATAVRQAERRPAAPQQGTRRALQGKPAAGQDADVGQKGDHGHRRRNRENRATDEGHHTRQRRHATRVQHPNLNEGRGAGQRRGADRVHRQLQAVRLRREANMLVLGRRTIRQPVGNLAQLHAARVALRRLIPQVAALAGRAVRHEVLPGDKPVRPAAEAERKAHRNHTEQLQKQDAAHTRGNGQKRDMLRRKQKKHNITKKNPRFTCTGT